MAERKTAGVNKGTLAVAAGTVAGLLAIGLLALHHNTAATVLAAEVRDVRQAAAHLDTREYGTDLGSLQIDVGKTHQDLRKTIDAPRSGVCTKAATATGDAGRVQAEVAAMHGQPALAGSLAYLANRIGQLRAESQRIGLRAPTATAAIASAKAAAARAEASRQTAYVSAAALASRAERYAAQADAACRRAGG